MSFFNFNNVRARLTVWYAVALTLVLVIYSVGVFVFVRDNMLSELDRKLRVDIETTEEVMQDLPSNAQALEVTRSYPESRDRSLLEVWTDQMIYSEAGTSDSSLGNPAADCQNKSIAYKLVELPDDIHMRFGCKKVLIGEKAYFIRAARSADRVYQEYNTILFVMIFGLPLAIGVSVIGGYFIAKRALAPISRMTDQANQISAERLSERLAVGNPEDELGKLATTFNRTFERLEKSFDQMKRFTSDASHELRTPLTAIRTMGEVSLRENLSANDYKETISSILEEADHLRHLVDNLLALSRADAGHIKLNKQKEDLIKLTQEVINHLGVLAEEKNQVIKIIFTDSLTAEVDRGIFRQAVVNLIDNAIKYSPNNTQVTVDLTTNGPDAIIEVRDEGPGISEVHKHKVFERFYRIDEGRSRDQGGTGLGLSIAQWAIEAHGGQLTVHDHSGAGSLFRIRIPTV